MGCSLEDHWSIEASRSEGANAPWGSQPIPLDNLVTTRTVQLF